MCGIVGYIGEKQVVPVLVEGLRKLEYRGYDSAGVAVVRPDGIEVRRSAGKLSRLEDVLKTTPLAGDYGIGHTRWATHGRPTEENAHPHRDDTGRTVVVHNGIIENYLELKQRARLRDGHKFQSETDTEIVAHLVARELKNGAGSLEVAAAEDAGARPRPVRAGADVVGRSGEDRRRPQRPADRRRHRRAGIVRRLRHPRDPQPHPRRGLPRGRRDGRADPPGRRLLRLRRAKPRTAQAAADRRGTR